MRACTAVIALLLAACGSTSRDPGTGSAACSVAVSSSVSVGTMSNQVSATTMSCNGTVPGKTVDCGSSATVSKATCSDGYGFTITGGNVTLLLRLQNPGDGHWVGGASLSGATAPLSGSISALGLTPDLTPPAGSKQSYAFVFQATTDGAAANLDGQFPAAW